MRAAKIDRNQNIIVDAFRDLGASVLILSRVGQGCPDICIGINRLNVLVEIKAEKGKLTKDQEKFHAEWRGDARIIRTVEEACNLVAELRSPGL